MSSVIENSEYPDEWDDYVGQAAAKRHLQVASISAKSRNVPLPHMIIAAGEGGSGKSALAVLVAKKVGADVKTVSGPIRASEARIMMLSMSDGDVLYIDEAHGLVVGGKAKSDWLLNYMQDGVIVGAFGEEQMPHVTIIAATTEAGKLPEPLLSRFQLRISLVPYTDAEAAEIGRKMAPKIFGELPHPNDDALIRIAKAANNNPRNIKMLLSNMRDMAIVDGVYPKKGDYNVAETLDLVGLTEDGLDKQARDYLIALLRFPDGIGKTAIAEVLQEPGGLAPTENVLLRKDFIMKLKSGRALTGAGIKRAHELKAERDEAQMSDDYGIVA